MPSDKKHLPARVRETQSDFFWKALEVAIGVSIFLLLQCLFVWAGEARHGSLLLILLPFALLNTGLAYVNIRDAVRLYRRWQDALWEHR
ncbi:MAG: hypothetical protein SFU56_09100 [Capsulimonadales bacterium]|nr:hypothetical protein [Capsulimonadales bacterium]